MRILLISENIDFISKLKNKLNNFIIDSVKLIKDAEYYLLFRNYDCIIIDKNSSCLEFRDLYDFITSEFIENKAIIIGIGINSDTIENKKRSEIDFLRTGGTEYIYINDMNEEILEIFKLRIIAALRLKIKYQEYSISLENNSNIFFSKDEVKIIFNSITVELSKNEFSLLSIISSREGCFSKEQLMDLIFEEPELVESNIISKMVNSLREKTIKYLNIDFIETVRGRGYRFINH